MQLTALLDTSAMDENQRGTSNAPPNAFPRKVTLCGSTRFKRAFLEWNRRLTLQGHLVYSVAFWTHATEGQPSAEAKRALDLVHKRKIEASDEIFVLDVNGYIGDSTRSEVELAKALGKEVRFLSKEYPRWTEQSCRYLSRDELKLLA